MAYEGTVVSERFEIISLTGEGGMGMVYRALDRSSGQLAALKILRADTKSTHRERFAREARLLAKLEHPSIVKYLAHGFTAQSEPFLAMEWLEGEDLAARLKRTGVSATETMRIIHHAANALAVAHANGVVHRDIKPSNLFLVDGEVDRIKMLDFGIAHIQASADAMTRTGSAIGTPGYMAPEQARGSRDIDARADVFSLGCVMFECLAGRPPFQGDTSMAVLAKILLEDAPRLGKVCTNPPAALEELVGKMLEKDQVNRPRDCSVVAAALETIGDVSSLEMARRKRDSAVTIGEQRLVCVVVAGDVVFGPDRAITHETIADTPRSLARETMASAHTVAAEHNNSNQMLVALSAAVATYGGRAEVMADGSVVVSLFGQGAATDQAARAARCALAVRRILPDASMALAIGRSGGDRLRLGDLIDRAATMVASPVDAREHPAIRPIRVDEVAAGLLDVRFGIEGDDDGLVLVGERDIADPMRMLLGKPTPCVGRERELATLQALFADCISEPMAHIVVVTGAPGIGKSRFRHEVMAQLATQDVEVWIGSGDPMSVGAPFAMLAQALRRAAGIVDGEPLAVRHKKLNARALRHVSPGEAPRVVEFLGELVGAPLPDEESVQLRAARQDPQLMGDQMLRACEDFVSAECAARPLVLILEDLQWGDLPTVRAVDSIVRQLPDRPLLVLALARPDVDTLFPRLWAERRVVRIHLGELTKRASEKLACHALGKQPGDALVGRLVEGAAGNPFYLEELIRSFAEGKGERLPGSVLAMAQARIESLEPEARQVLRAASFFGPVFWRTPVRELLEGGTTRTDDWMQELVRRELIVERRQTRFPGEPEFAFRHGLVREAAYAMLTESDRTKGHRHAGRWLEARIRGGDAAGTMRASEAEAVILAEHFERGGDPRRSTSWYRQAAQQALEGDDLVAAIDRAERAVQCISATVETTADDHELVGELRQLQSAAHLWRGDFELAVNRGRDALDRLPPATERWLVAAGTVADACGRRLEYEPVIELCKQLVDVPSTASTYRAYAYAVAMATQAALWVGDAEVLARLYARLDEIEKEASAAPANTHAAALAWIYSARSWRSMRDGDLAQCVVLDTNMVECFTEVGDLRHACQQRGNLGYDELMLGAYTRAERSLRETISTATRYGLHQITAQAQHNLGMAIAYQGRVDEGREVEEQALLLFVGQGNRKLDAAARGYLAVIETLAGNYPLAIRYASEAIAMTGDAPGLRCQIHAAKSIACRLSGELDQALVEAKAAIHIIEIHGRPEEGDNDARLALAEALHATGATGPARAAILEAELQLHAVAAKILDPEGRRSYLAIPTNARTLELAAAWR